MPGVGEMYSRLTVTVISPDGQIKTTLRPPMKLTLDFRPSTFTRYEQADLEYQLSRSLDLVWQGHRQGRDQAIIQAGGEPHRDDHIDWDANRRRYHQAMRAVTAVGKAPGRLIRVHTTGMREFTVRIKPGCLPEFTEAGFATELAGAMSAAHHEFESQTLALKDQHFDIRPLSLASQHSKGVFR